MSRVLVIGGWGVLGQPVADELEVRGKEVHRASRKPRQLSATSHHVDLLDQASTEELLKAVAPDVVVQMTGGDHSSPASFTGSYVTATLNLLRAVNSSGTSPRVFVTGSAAEYGDPGPGRVAESSPTRPVTPYGWIKLVQTDSARRLAELLDVDLTVLRPFNIVSDRLPSASALGNFRRQILEGPTRQRTAVAGRVDVIRDWVPAKYVGEAIADLVDASTREVINVCTGVGRSLEAVMRATADHLDVELRIEQDEALLAVPAPSSVIGDPRRLFLLARSRPDSSLEALATALIGTL